MTNDRSVAPEVLFSVSLELALAQDLASIPQVHHVLADWAESSLLIWVTVDNPEPDVRRRIYEKELDLITNFPEVNFDFNLIPTMGRQVAEIITDARVVYSRPE